jgi:hypothetical protein
MYIYVSESQEQGIGGGSGAIVVHLAIGYFNKRYI